MSYKYLLLSRHHKIGSLFIIGFGIRHRRTDHHSLCRSNHSEKPVRVAMETLNLSDGNEQIKRKSVAAEKVVDELVALFKHYTDWPIDSSNLVYNVNLLMDVMVIEGLMYEKGGRVKKTETGYTPFETLMYFCAQFSTKKLFAQFDADPATKKKTVLSNEGKNYESSDEGTKQLFSPTFTHDATNSADSSALSASTTIPSADGSRTFEGEYRQHWKVGTRIQLLHSIDWLPGIVIRVSYSDTCDMYDVKLDNGDSVLNVRSYLLRTMEIPIKVVWWTDFLTFLVAVIAATLCISISACMVLAVMVKLGLKAVM